MNGSYTAGDLYKWIEDDESLIYLDVRNEEDFSRFSVEGPNEISLINIPYFDFIENPSMASTRLPKDIPIRVICAKEGSAKFVAEILQEQGYVDVLWLQEGIVSWGNVLIPKQIPSPSNYNLWQFNRPGKASCSYGLVSGKELAIFDASRNVDFYLSFAKKLGVNISHVFETHLQADYISGGPRLSEEAGVQYLAHEEDYSGSHVNYRPVQDGEKIVMNNGTGPEILVNHSPGHTPGSTTYVIDEKFMISGDTVFIVSIGRPDLGKKVVEWASRLYETLKHRIGVLPDSLLVLPGHYTDWENESDDDFRIMNDFGTVKQINEKIYSIDDEEEFIKFIVENMREQPAVYNEIRKVNAGLITPSDEEQNVMDLGKNECAASHMLN